MQIIYKRYCHKCLRKTYRIYGTYKFYKDYKPYSGDFNGSASFSAPGR